jgi:hypothetical protein
MAENINITCNIKNETGNQLTVNDSGLSWGKWQNTPQSIDNNSSNYFKASGRKDSASGTTGYVTFEAFDGTLFTVNFDIKWGSEANSISNKTTGKNPTNFEFYRTDSNYNKLDNPSGDPGSSPVTVYYLVKKR